MQYETSWYPVETADKILGNKAMSNVRTSDVKIKLSLWETSQQLERIMGTNYISEFINKLCQQRQTSWNQFYVIIRDQECFPTSTMCEFEIKQVIQFNNSKTRTSWHILSLIYQRIRRMWYKYKVKHKLGQFKHFVSEVQYCRKIKQIDSWMNNFREEQKTVFTQRKG